LVPSPSSQNHGRQFGAGSLSTHRLKPPLTNLLSLTDTSSLPLLYHPPLSLSVLWKYSRHAPNHCITHHPRSWLCWHCTASQDAPHTFFSHLGNVVSLSSFQIYSFRRLSVPVHKMNPAIYFIACPKTFCSRTDADAMYIYFHVSFKVVVPLAGAVALRLGSDSHLMVLPWMLTYLYWNVVPAGMETVMLQIG